MGFDDFGDGFRVWDLECGVVDFGEVVICCIEFLLMLVFEVFW